MGHYLTGDWGFEVRTFPELAYLAFPRHLSGVGVGQGGLELRWVLLDGDEDVLDDVFLSDLPPALRARLDHYPQKRDDILLPMPCRIEDLAGMVARDMRAVAPALRKKQKDCTEVRIALTPTWRIDVSEIDEALDIVRAELPKKLRARLDRAALASEKRKSTRRDFPASPLVDELSAAVPSKAGSFLLCAVTWLLWHLDQARKDAHHGFGVTDDSTLYEIALDEELDLSRPTLDAVPVKCRKQVDVWTSALYDPDVERDPPVLREHRLEALAWTVNLPIRDPHVGRALEASAHAWGLLERQDRAIAEVTWALILRATPSLYNSRGYHRHLSRDFEGAIQDYTCAIARRRTAQYLTNRAEAHLDLGRPQKCVADARAALRVSARDAEAKKLLAKAESMLELRHRSRAGPHRARREAELQKKR